MVDSLHTLTDKSKEVLIEVPAGRYLMAEKTAFLRIEKPQTGLLVDEIGENYKVVLVNDKLVIL